MRRKKEYTGNQRCAGSSRPKYNPELFFFLDLHAFPAFGRGSFEVIPGPFDKHVRDEIIAQHGIDLPECLDSLFEVPIVKQGNRLVMELPGFFGVRIDGIPNRINPYALDFTLHGDFIQQARGEFLIEAGTERFG
jgi:hypothetical protein